MRGKEMYYSTDFTKFLVDVVKSSDAEISYIGECPYQRVELTPGTGYTGEESYKKSIRRIKKIIEYTDGRMEIFYPVGDNSFRFKRDDRYTLNYI